jgi:hypothetical protein
VSEGDVNAYIVNNIIDTQYQTHTGFTEIEIAHNQAPMVTSETVLDKQVGLVANITKANDSSSNIVISNNQVTYMGDVENTSAIMITPLIGTITNASVTLNKNYVTMSDLNNKEVACFGTIDGNDNTTKTIVTASETEITIDNIYDKNSGPFFVKEVNGENLEVNVSENKITYNNLENISNSSLIGSITNVMDSSINIDDNKIRYDRFLNCNNISGILSENVKLISDSTIIINKNEIIMDDIDEQSSGITGIQLIDTNDESLSECIDLNLTITNNTILTNTEKQLINPNKCNSSMFSTNINIDPTPTPLPYKPTGILTITGNRVIPDKLLFKRDVYFSDIYLPAKFRPYIFNLPGEYPGSKYWWTTVNTDIDPSKIDYVVPGRGGTDDTVLRQIFKRAILAINQQSSFQLYPFYHIKVKGLRS